MSATPQRHPYRVPVESGSGRSFGASWMKPWHHHLGILIAVAIFVLALPDGFRHEHPWSWLFILFAMTLDNQLGYHYGRSRQRNALAVAARRIESCFVPLPAALSESRDAQSWNDGYAAGLKDAVSVVMDEGTKADG